MADVIGITSLVLQLVETLPDSVRKIASWKITKQEVHDGIKEQEQDIHNLTKQLQNLLQWAEQLGRMSNDVSIGVIKTHVHSCFSKLEQFRETVGSLKGQHRSRWNKLFPSLLTRKLDKLQDDQTQLIADVQKIIAILIRQQDRIHSLSISQSQMEHQFRPVWHLVPRNPPGLYFDFKSTDVDGKPLTPEGKLREAVFSSTHHGSVGAIAKGQGGVGKTCAICELGRLLETRERFPGGVFFGKLGAEANLSTLIGTISKFVKLSGSALKANEIIVMKNLDEAVMSAADWFQNEQCLFIFDDIWAVGGIPSNVVDVLSSIAVHPQSQILFSTRDTIMNASTNVVFEERAHFGQEAHKMIQAASNMPFPKRSTAQLFYNEIMESCSGLPIALRLAGSAVRSLAEGRCRSMPEDAWEQYAKNAKSMERQQKTVMKEILLKSLDFIVADTGFPVYQQRFESLCVLQNNQQIPISVAARLWNTDEGDADETIYLFERFSVVRVYNRYKDQFITSIGLHDILLDISRQISTEKKLWPFYTQRLLISYIPMTSFSSSSSLSSSGIQSYGSHSMDLVDTSQISRGLSNTSLKECKSKLDKYKESWKTLIDDGYILENLFYLFTICGRNDDILWLLNRPQWIINQLSSSGLSQVESDILTGLKLLQASEWEKKMGSERHLKWLGILRRVVRESYIFIQRSSWTSMPWFQIYSRLQHIDEHYFNRPFLKELEMHAPKPWASPSLGCLPPPDGKLEDTMFYEGTIICQSLQETTVLLVYHTKEKVLLDEYCRFTKSLKRRETIIDQVLLREIMEVAFSENGNIAVLQTFRGAIVIRRKEESGQGTVEKSLSVESGLDWNVTSRKATHFNGIYRISNAGTFSSSFLGGDCVIGSVMEKNWGIIELGCNWKDMIVSAISADGRIAAFVRSNGTIIIFRHIVGQQWEKYHESPPSEEDQDQSNDFSLSTLSLSTDGSHVVLGSGEGKIHLLEHDGIKWNRSVLVGHEDNVSTIALSTNGHRIISGSFDKTVRIWEKNKTRQWEHSVLVEHDHWVSYVSISGDGKYAITSAKDLTAKLWNLDGETYVQNQQTGHTHWVLDVAVNNPGDMVFSCSRDQSLRMWQKTNSAWADTVLGMFEAAASCVEISGNGSTLVSGVDNLTIHVYRYDDGTWHPASELQVQSPAKSIKLSHSGRRFVCACASGIVLVWDGVNNGDSNYNQILAWKSYQLHVTGMYTANLPAIDISQDGNTIVGGIDHGEIRIWKYEGTEWMVQDSIKNHFAPVLSVSLAVDCKRFASASRDRTIRVWDLGDDNKWVDLVLADDTTFFLNCSVAFSADGMYISARGNAGYSRSWILKEGSWICNSPKPYVNQETAEVAQTSRPMAEDLHFATRARNVLCTKHGYVLQLGRPPFLSFVDRKG